MQKYTTLKYILLILLLFGLIFALSTLNEFATPYKELAKLPKCSNGVIVTSELLSTLKNQSDSIISSGAGKEYFVNHYQFLNTEYHLGECTFSIKYEYYYETIRQQMSVNFRVFNETNIETTEVNALIRPVQILINSTSAESIALKKGVDYDYYRREISIEQQTIYYRFYKESLTEGVQVVLELDAQSSEVSKIQKPQQFIPLV